MWRGQIGGSMGSAVSALLASGIIAALATSAVGEPVSVATGDLHRFVSGKTVVLNTGIGPLPISFRENGTMHGRAGSQPLAAYAGQAQDHGVWWIQGGQVCQRWSKWLEGRAQCVTFEVNGRQLHWRSTDGYEGTAVIASH